MIYLGVGSMAVWLLLFVWTLRLWSKQRRVQSQLRELQRGRK